MSTGSRGVDLVSPAIPGRDTWLIASATIVLAVIDALKLNRPVIAGHSIAGEELSSIGSRHPERVAGLIYLEAGYPYAYYDHARGDFAIDLGELRRKLEEMEFGRLPQDPRPLVQEVLENTLPAFERDLRELQKSMVATPPPASAGAPPRPAFAPAAIIEGQRKYSDVRAPILAIYALPHAPPAAIRNNPEAVAKADARDEASTGAQAKAFEAGLPSARVVRLAHASHYVFLSNESDVLREMNAFIGSLP